MVKHKTGVGKCPNWTSPNYWGYNHQQIRFQVMFKIPKTGHLPTPAKLNQPFPLFLGSSRPLNTAPSAFGSEFPRTWEAGRSTMASKSLITISIYIYVNIYTYCVIYIYTIYTYLYIYNIKCINIYSVYIYIYVNIIFIHRRVNTKLPG